MVSFCKARRGRSATKYGIVLLAFLSATLALASGSLTNPRNVTAEAINSTHGSVCGNFTHTELIRLNQINVTTNVTNTTTETQIVLEIVEIFNSSANAYRQNITDFPNCSAFLNSTSQNCSETTIVNVELSGSSLVKTVHFVNFTGITNSLNLSVVETSQVYPVVEVVSLRYTIENIDNSTFFKRSKKTVVAKAVKSVRKVSEKTIYLPADKPSSFQTRSSYRRGCIVCSFGAIVHYRNPRCEILSSPCNETYYNGIADGVGKIGAGASTAAFCLENITTIKNENKLIDEELRYVNIQNETREVFQIISSFIESNPEYVTWNLIFAFVTVMYILYMPRLLSFFLAFVINHTYFRNTDEEIMIGNIRFAFLGGKIELSNFQYVTKNTIIKIHRLSATLQWWNQKIRYKELWLHKYLSLERQALLYKQQKRFGAKPFKGRGVYSGGIADGVSPASVFGNSHDVNDRGKIPRGFGRNHQDSNGQFKHKSNNDLGFSESGRVSKEINVDKERPSGASKAGSSDPADAQDEYFLPYRLTIDVLGMEIMALNNSRAYDELQRLKEYTQKSSVGSKSEKHIHEEETHSISPDEGNERGQNSNKIDSGPGDVHGDLGTGNVGSNISFARLVEITKAFQLPAFYRVCPTSKVRIRNANIYVSSERLPTVLVCTIQNTILRHTAILMKEIKHAPTRFVDQYRMFTRADVHDVAGILIGNSDQRILNINSELQRRQENEHIKGPDSNSTNSQLGQANVPGSGGSASGAEGSRTDDRAPQRPISNDNGYGNSYNRGNESRPRFNRVDNIGIVGVDNVLSVARGLWKDTKDTMKDATDIVADNLGDIVGREHVHNARKTSPDQASGDGRREAKDNLSSSDSENDSDAENEPEENGEPQKLEKQSHVVLDIHGNIDEDLMDVHEIEEMLPNSEYENIIDAEEEQKRTFRLKQGGYNVNDRRIASGADEEYAAAMENQVGNGTATYAKSTRSQSRFRLNNGTKGRKVEPQLFQCSRLTIKHIFDHPGFVMLAAKSTSSTNDNPRNASSDVENTYGKHVNKSNTLEEYPGIWDGEPDPEGYEDNYYTGFTREDDTMQNRHILLKYSTKNLPAPLHKIEVDISGEGNGVLFSYGAWADRQRVLFMEHFFPTNYQDLLRYVPSHGDYRQNTSLKIEFYFHYKSTIRVPYRKQSLHDLAGGPRSLDINEPGEKLTRSPDKGTKTDDTKPVSSDSARLSESQPGSGIEMVPLSTTGPSSRPYEDGKHLNGSSIKKRTGRKRNSVKESITMKQLKSGPLGEAIATGKELNWVEIVLQEGSRITYEMPYYAVDESGCESKVHIDAKNAEIYVGGRNGSYGNISKIIEGDAKPFFVTKNIKISAEMQYPVVYNAARTWKFNYALHDASTDSLLQRRVHGMDNNLQNVQSPNTVMMFLRQHWNVLSDIANDFSEASVFCRAPGLHDFQPTKYTHTLLARQCRINLNLNEKNVIDRFGEMDMNSHAIIEIPRISVKFVNDGGLKFNNKTSNNRLRIELSGAKPKDDRTEYGLNGMPRNAQSPSSRNDNARQNAADYYAERTYYQNNANTVDNRKPTKYSDDDAPEEEYFMFSDSPGMEYDDGQYDWQKTGDKNYKGRNGRFGRDQRGRWQMSPEDLAGISLDEKISAIKLDLQDHETQYKAGKSFVDKSTTVPADSRFQKCTITLREPKNNYNTKVLGLSTKESHDNDNPDSHTSVEEQTFLSFHSFTVSGEVAALWEQDYSSRNAADVHYFGKKPSLGIVDKYNFTFGISGVSFLCTPSAINALAQVQDNYFGNNTYVVKSEEIYHWGGRNFRSVMAGREWAVSSKDIKRVDRKKREHVQNKIFKSKTLDVETSDTAANGKYNADAMQQPSLGSHAGKYVNESMDYSKNIREPERLNDSAIKSKQRHQLKLCIAHFNPYHYSFSFNVEDVDFLIPSSASVANKKQRRKNPGQFPDGRARRPRNRTWSRPQRDKRAPPSERSGSTAGSHQYPYLSGEKLVEQNGSTFLTVQFPEFQAQIHSRAEQYGSQYTNLIATVDRPITLYTVNGIKARNILDKLSSISLKTSKSETWRKYINVKNVDHRAKHKKKKEKSELLKKRSSGDFSSSEEFISAHKEVKQSVAGMIAVHPGLKQGVRHLLSIDHFHLNKHSLYGTHSGNRGEIQSLLKYKDDCHAEVGNVNAEFDVEDLLVLSQAVSSLNYGLGAQCRKGYGWCGPVESEVVIQLNSLLFGKKSGYLARANNKKEKFILNLMDKMVFLEFILGDQKFTSEQAYVSNLGCIWGSEVSTSSFSFQQKAGESSGEQPPARNARGDSSASKSDVASRSRSVIRNSGKVTDTGKEEAVDQGRYMYGTDDFNSETFRSNSQRELYALADRTFVFQIPEAFENMPVICRIYSVDSNGFIKREDKGNGIAMAIPLNVEPGRDERELYSTVQNTKYEKKTTATASSVFSDESEISSERGAKYPSGTGGDATSSGSRKNSSTNYPVRLKSLGKDNNIILSCSVQKRSIVPQRSVGPRGEATASTSNTTGASLLSEADGTRVEPMDLRLQHKFIYPVLPMRRTLLDQRNHFWWGTAAPLKSHEPPSIVADVLLNNLQKYSRNTAEQSSRKDTHRNIEQNLAPHSILFAEEEVLFLQDKLCLTTFTLTAKACKVKLACEAGNTPGCSTDKSQVLANARVQHILHLQIPRGLNLCYDSKVTANDHERLVLSPGSSTKSSSTKAPFIDPFVAVIEYYKTIGDSCYMENLFWEQNQIFNLEHIERGESSGTTNKRNGVTEELFFIQPAHVTLLATVNIPAKGFQLTSSVRHPNRGMKNEIDLQNEFLNCYDTHRKQQILKTLAIDIGVGSSEDWVKQNSGTWKRVPYSTHSIRNADSVMGHDFRRINIADEQVNIDTGIYSTTDTSGIASQDRDRSAKLIAFSKNGVWPAEKQGQNEPDRQQVEDSDDEIRENRNSSCSVSDDFSDEFSSDDESFKHVINLGELHNSAESGSSTGPSGPIQRRGTEIIQEELTDVSYTTYANTTPVMDQTQSVNNTLASGEVTLDAYTSFSEEDSFDSAKEIDDSMLLGADESNIHGDGSTVNTTHVHANDSWAFFHPLIDDKTELARNFDATAASKDQRKATGEANNPVGHKAMMSSWRRASMVQKDVPSSVTQGFRKKRLYVPRKRANRRIHRESNRRMYQKLGTKENVNIFDDHGVSCSPDKADLSLHPGHSLRMGLIREHIRVKEHVLKSLKQRKKNVNATEGSNSSSSQTPGGARNVASNPVIPKHTYSRTYMIVCDEHIHAKITPAMLNAAEAFLVEYEGSVHSSSRNALSLMDAFEKAIFQSSPGSGVNLNRCFEYGYDGLLAAHISEEDREFLHYSAQCFYSNYFNFKRYRPMQIHHLIFHRLLETTNLHNSTSNRYVSKRTSSVNSVNNYLVSGKGISVNTYQNCYGDRVVCHGEYDAESIRTKCKTRQHTNVPKPSLLMTINDVNFSRAVSFSDMQCRSQTMVSNFFDARSFYGTLHGKNNVLMALTLMNIRARVSYENPKGGLNKPKKSHGLKPTEPSIDSKSLANGTIDSLNAVVANDTSSPAILFGITKEFVDAFESLYAISNLVFLRKQARVLCLGNYILDRAEVFESNQEKIYHRVSEEILKNAKSYNAREFDNARNRKKKGYSNNAAAALQRAHLLRDILRQYRLPDKDGVRNGSPYDIGKGSPVLTPDQLAKIIVMANNSKSKDRIVNVIQTLLSHGQVINKILNTRLVKLCTSTYNGKQSTGESKNIMGEAFRFFICNGLNNGFVRRLHENGQGHVKSTFHAFKHALKDASSGLLSNFVVRNGSHVEKFFSSDARLGATQGSWSTSAWQAISGICCKNSFSTIFRSHQDIVNDKTSSKAERCCRERKQFHSSLNIQNADIKVVANRKIYGRHEVDILFHLRSESTKINTLVYTKTEITQPSRKSTERHHVGQRKRSQKLRFKTPADEVEDEVTNKSKAQFRTENRDGKRNVMNILHKNVYSCTTNVNKTIVKVMVTCAPMFKAFLDGVDVVCEASHGERSEEPNSHSLGAGIDKNASKYLKVTEGEMDSENESSFSSSSTDISNISEGDSDSVNETYFDDMGHMETARNIDQMIGAQNPRQGGSITKRHTSHVRSATASLAVGGTGNGNVRATEEHTMPTRSQLDSIRKEYHNKKKERGAIRSLLASRIEEHVETHFCAQTCFSTLEMEATGANTMDPFHLAFRDLSLINGGAAPTGETLNFGSNVGDESTTIRAFHSIKTKQMKFFLLHRGMDERNTIVITKPTIVMDDILLHLSTNGTEASNPRNDIHQSNQHHVAQAGQKSGALVTVGVISADFPLDKFNHKRLETTLQEWISALAFVRRKNDTHKAFSSNNPANVKQSKTGKIGSGTLPKNSTIGLSFAVTDRLVFSASPISSVYVQYMLGPTNIHGHIPLEALTDVSSEGSVRLMLGHSHLCVLTGLSASQFRASRLAKGVRHLVVKQDSLNTQTNDGEDVNIKKSNTPTQDHGVPQSAKFLPRSKYQWSTTFPTRRTEAVYQTFPSLHVHAQLCSGSPINSSISPGDIPSKRSINVQLVVPKVKHRFTPEILESFLVLQQQMGEELTMLLGALEKFIEESNAPPSATKGNVYKDTSELQMPIFEYTWLFQFEGMEIVAGLDIADDIPSLSLSLNTGDFSLTKRDSEGVGKVEFTDLTVQFSSGQGHITDEEVLGLMQTNIFVETRYKSGNIVASKSQSVSNVVINQTGFVLRAGFFLRLQYMISQYRYHINRYSERSQFLQPMVQAVLNASSSNIMRSVGLQPGKNISSDNTVGENSEFGNSDFAYTGELNSGQSRQEDQPGIKQVVKIDIKETSVVFCNRLRRVTNDNDDKESGLVITLGNICLEGHEEKIRKAQSPHLSSNWYGQCAITKLQTSFVLKVEGKLSSGRHHSAAGTVVLEPNDEGAVGSSTGLAPLISAWFDAKNHNKSVTWQIPGVQSLVLWDSHRKEGKIRVTIERIHMQLNASIIRLLLSTHTTWSASESQKIKWRQVQPSHNSAAPGQRKNFLYRNGVEEDAFSNASSKGDSFSDHSMSEDEQETGDDNFTCPVIASFEYVLISAPGQCLVYDHNGSKQLFGLAFPKIHSGGLINVNKRHQLDIMSQSNFICTKFQITPELMVFLSELVNEIREIRTDIVAIKQKYVRHKILKQQNKGGSGGTYRRPANGKIRRKHKSSRKKSRKGKTVNNRNRGKTNDPFEGDNIDDSGPGDMDYMSQDSSIDADSVSDWENDSDDFSETDSEDEDSFSVSGAFESSFLSVIKSVVLFRVTSLQFVVGCLPVTEESIMISFNKPIDIVLSTDSVDPREYQVKDRQLNLMSMTVTIPIVRATLQEAYQASNIELTVSDIKAQLNMLFGLRVDAPVELAYIDVGSMDAFFSMTSLERIHTFIAAWASILNNAKVVMAEEAVHFWGEDGKTSRSAQVPDGPKSNDGYTETDGAQMVLSTATRILCGAVTKIKLKIRKVPLHTLEHTEIEAVMRDVEYRAMEPGIVYGKRAMVSSFFGSISDTKVSIFPARGRHSSGALDGVFVCERVCTMVLQDYSQNTFISAYDPDTWASWQGKWMHKKKAVNTFGLLVGPSSGRLMLTERSGAPTTLLTLDPMLWTFILTERLEKTEKKKFNVCSLDGQIVSDHVLKMRISHQTAPFLIKWFAEVMRVIAASKAQAIRSLTDQGYVYSSTMFTKQRKDMGFWGNDDMSRFEPNTYSGKGETLASSSDNDLLDYQAHGVITLYISQMNFIFPAERSYGASRGSMSPYVGFYAKQVFHRFVQQLDDQGDDVSRSLSMNIGIAAVVIGKIKDKDGSISGRDEKDLVVFPTSHFTFQTKHRVTRSVGREYQRSSKRNRQEKLIVYYTLRSAFTDAHTGTANSTRSSAMAESMGMPSNGKLDNSPFSDNKRLGRWDGVSNDETGSTGDNKTGSKKPGAIKVSNEFDDYHILTQVQQSYVKWYSKANIETGRSASSDKKLLLGRKDAYERRRNIKRILHLDSDGRKFHNVVHAFQFAPKLKIHGLDEYEIKLSTYLSKFTSVERNKDTGEIESLSRVMDTYFIGFFKRFIVGAIAASHTLDVTEAKLNNALSKKRRSIVHRDRKAKVQNDDFEGDGKPNRRTRRRQRKHKGE